MDSFLSNNTFMNSMMTAEQIQGNQHSLQAAPLKIGLVAPFFLPRIGGANIYCYELAKSLAAKGHEVHLFTVEGALKDNAYTLHPVLTLDLAKDLRVLRGYHMDVWHALFFFYAPLALYRKNVFVTGHGDDCFSFRIRFSLPGKAFLAKHFLWRLGKGRLRERLDAFLVKREAEMNYWLTHLALRRVRHIITVSSFTQLRLNQRYPTARSKNSVIPPGVSERFFEHPVRPPSGRASGVASFLTVTRLDGHDRIKNVHGVISALAELKDDYDFRYRIISGAHRGSYCQELEDQIRASGLQDRVSIEGRKTDEELLEIYRSADLFILVSYAEPKNFEGFGIVFLEANASGVPVLTSREGGMVDYVQEGKNGFYVQDTSPTGIRLALKRYLDGEIEFDREKIREYPQSFRWAGITDRVLSIYK